jgi:hypothetical protein
VSAVVGSRILAARFGEAPAAAPYQAPALGAIDTAAVIAEFANRLRTIEQSMQASGIGKDGILSQIALSREAILIQSSRIGIVGEVTFADYIRDLNGTSTGILDPSLTTIRGGVIRTGKVASLDGQSWLDLDASGPVPFLRSRSALAINADGTFSFGSGSGKTLTWDGSDLRIGTSTYLNTTPTGTVVTNAATGAAEAGAYTLASAKLAKAGGDTLTGIIDLQITSNYNAALRVGSVTWNTSTGALTGGTGVVMSRSGLLGVKAGIATFFLDATTGDATFAGALSGATGTFAGSLSAATGTFAGSLSAATVSTNNIAAGGYIYALGNYSGVSLTLNGNTYTSSIFGRGAAGYGNAGVIGYDDGSSGTRLGVAGVQVACSNGIGVGGNGYLVGVYGENTSSASGYGVWARNSVSGGIGLRCDGKMEISTTSMVANLYATWGDASRLLYAASGSGWGTHYFTPDDSAPAAGAATATFTGTNKPGSATSNTWWKVWIDGAAYYIPLWS